MAKLYAVASLSGVELDEYRRMAAVEDDMWFYRALRGHIERELATALEGSRRAVPGKRREFRLLDAGCGTGGLMRGLERRHPHWRWTGIDLEPLARELARSRCSAEIVEGDLTALPFPTDTFDAVVCSDVLYHLDDDAAALREIFRVLKPGGLLVLNVPAHRWLWSYHDVTVHGRRRYERAGLRQMLRAAGFEVERLTHWNALPLPLIVIRRKLLPAPRSGSDVQLYPPLIEAIFRAGTAVENAWLRSVGSLPFGSSILGTARKPTM